ncbi:hypothetical protein J3R82DRAFT_5864 [Butyriboletus roseoflavus]|nr:hypothetical protein J3R82DRAFT_5864 [Butyriboletus roseoflavus]
MDSFEPTIVAGLGYANNRAQLMSVPPFATAFVCAWPKTIVFVVLFSLRLGSMISAFMSDHYHCRGWTTIFFSILEIIGFSMFYGSLSPI